MLDANCHAWMDVCDGDNYMLNDTATDGTQDRGDVMPSGSPSIYNVRYETFDDSATIPNNLLNNVHMDHLANALSNSVSVGSNWSIPMSGHVRSEYAPDLVDLGGSILTPQLSPQFQDLGNSRQVHDSTSNETQTHSPPPTTVETVPSPARVTRRRGRPRKPCPTEENVKKQQQQQQQKQQHPDHHHQRKQQDVPADRKVTRRRNKQNEQAEIKQPSPSEKVHTIASGVWSLESGAGEESIGDSGRNKITRIRERNRIAADKCRMRKKGEVERLKSKHETLEAANKKLAETLTSLLAQNHVLKNMLMAHADCDCDLIQQYLRKMATDWVSKDETGRISPLLLGSL